ncbi:uncharacterized protein LOC125077820 isoform X1 [Vanessa atalanta]|uniref:uncharacterized protein LOC125077820 isoform X1 n=1 Tax=Vanessa atalanta TaxID=42275 RepID=UPI001FCDECEE|nr:uncharacterized protein LOC125077820 isoform X1 [Vanessa atalanta]
MDTPSENIIINSCQYTPVYFIENPSANQARSYIITPNSQSAEKPVSENLKRFYENSGKLETNLNGTENSSKPRILKKPECNVVGNNLKLASFLLPKSETKNESCKQVITPVNNVVLKPVYIANNPCPNPVPKLDVNSKIVKLKDLPNVIRSQNGKILPKIKPKENTSIKSKHTSVQLLKLGETYHSLNQLSDDQMKIVNHALKIFSNPQNSPPEPTYDPVTNTKFIYKVVSPKDLAVVGKNKMNKHKKVEVKKEVVRIMGTQETEVIDEQKIQVETKVTRSGRIVKLPKNMIAEESPNKPKRKNGQIVSCLQCTSKFSSPHRLHRHYEHHPTHLPSKLHSDLFQCLLSIVKTGSVEDGANNFVQQLDQFVNKLKSCIPCLLKSDDNSNGKPSIINDDIGRLLGINPGKYNLNIDALNCEKDKNGFCIHNPPPSILQTNECLLTTIEDTQILEPNKHVKIPNVSDNISMNTVLSDKLPIYVNNNDNRKHTLEWLNQIDSGKKIKLSPEGERDSVVIDDIVALLSDTEKTENSLESKNIDNVVFKNDNNKEKVQETVPVPVKSKPAHIQFRSTHFDIRSSPIKSSSTVFRKFQINPEKMAKYEVEIIRPIQLNKLAQEIEMCAEKTENEQKILDTNKTPVNSTEPLSYKSPKVWSSDQSESFTKCNSLISDQTDDFLKSDTLIEPALLHVKDGSAIPNMHTDNNEVDTNDISINQGQSIINFLESLGNELTSETAIRNNSIDFQLDLFSFNNS